MRIIGNRGTVRLTSNRPQPSRRSALRWLAVLPLVLALAAAGAHGQVSAAERELSPATPRNSMSAAYDSFDVGFAEGSGIADADLPRRLDGIAAYLPGPAPFVRVDLNWAHVQECKECPLRWDQLDPVVDGAAARGLRVLLILAYAPPWANGGHADDHWFPLQDADWTAIVDATVGHFGDKVAAYEVWNEPNIESFGGYDGDRKARYWQLVRLAHQRIHAACADCVVVAGASGNGTPSTETRNDNESAAWLEWAYANGYRGDFDAVAHHPYPAWSVGFRASGAECVTPWWNMFGPRHLPDCGELGRVRKVMERHGDGGKKIWGTELGYPTSGATNLALEVVRDRLVESVDMWRRLDYTGPLFLFSYRDACADFRDPECNFGVVTRDFTKKGVLFTDLSAALADNWPGTLGPGQTLRRWSSLLSTRRGFQLSLQDDDNLVVYRRFGKDLWATNTGTDPTTVGGDQTRLVNQLDGNLVLYRNDGTISWTSHTHGNGPSTLWMQDDGNLVLYRNSDGQHTWASGTVVGP